MKKILAIIISLILLTTCCLAEDIQPSTIEFNKMNDPDLLPYLKETVYQGILDNLDSDQYYVENVSAIYISDEYLEELAFNSQANLYFGYSIEELQQQFQGQRYYFTLSESNETTVKAWEPYDNPMETVIRNVAIGTGVILICVTVSTLTAGTAPAISMIFAIAAKTGTACALKGAAIGTFTGGALEYIKTGDFQKALNAAAIQGSEGFKWGAILGTISGGYSEASNLKGATLNGLTMDEAALIQRESGYPLGVIKEFHSMDEYEVYKKANLVKTIVGNKPALTRDIDWGQTDSFGKTNLERALNGAPPLDPDGLSYELHHVGQQNDSVLAIMTQSEHRGEGNFKILHDNLLESVIDRGEFALEKKEFWKTLGMSVMEGT